MRRKKSVWRRLSSAVLALAIAVAFMPLIGNQTAFAQDSQKKADRISFGEVSEAAKADGLDLETIKAMAADAGMSVDEVVAAAEAEGIRIMDQTDDVIEIGTSENADNTVDIGQMQAADADEGLSPADVPKAAKAGLPAVETARKGGSGNDSDEYQENDESFAPVNPSSAIGIAPGNRLLCSIEEEDATVTYQFTATKDAAYIFSSHASEDTKGRVVEYNSSSRSYGKQVVDDDSGESNNFQIEFRAKAGMTYFLQARYYSTYTTGSFAVSLVEDMYQASIDVSLDKTTGKARVSGTAVNDTFSELYVDDSRVYDVDVDGKASFNETIDMRDYDVGFHEIHATLNNHSDDIYYPYAVPTYIYGKPSNKLSNYSTTWKCFTYTGSGSYSKDYNCSIYLEYKKAGGSWSEPQGPIGSYESKTKKGLKANTSYKVQTYFGKKVEYDGETFLFTGKETGYVSKAQTIKTAKKTKPPVKSITTTKAKQYSRSWSLTLWIGGVPYVRYYKAWYTSFKAKVTMKKKPGTAGIYIGSVRKAGNKKVYSAAFVISGKKKGKKVKFTVQTYQNKTYGGFSPYYKKKVKIR